MQLRYLYLHRREFHTYHAAFTSCTTPGTLWQYFNIFSWNRSLLQAAKRRKLLHLRFPGQSTVNSAKLHHFLNFFLFWHSKIAVDFLLRAYKGQQSPECCGGSVHELHQLHSIEKKQFLSAVKSPVVSAGSS